MLNLGWRCQASMIIDSAITYYQRSTDIYLELDFKRKLPLGWLYSNLGKCYRIKGKLEKSNEYISKAISIYGRYKEKRGLVLKLKADLCLNNSDYPQMLEHRRELLKFRLRKHKSDSFEIMQCYSYISEAYIKMGDEKNAIENLEKVIHYRKENNIPEKNAPEL